MTSVNARAQDQRLRNTYALWLLSGLVGGHRYYLGRPFSAALQLALAIVSGLLLDRTPWPLYTLLAWWLTDALLIRLYTRPVAKREAATLNTTDTLDLKHLSELHRSSLQHRDYVKALDICRESLELIEATVGRNSSLYAGWQAELSEAQRLKGNPAQAISTLNIAIGLQEKLGDHAGLCTSLDYLAKAHVESGHPAIAMTVYRRLLEKQALAGLDGGKDHIRALISLAALTEQSLGAAEALPFFEEAARLSARLTGEQLELKARAFAGQAGALLGLDRLDEAQTLYERCINLLEAGRQPRGPLMVECRYGLGHVLLHKNLLPEADQELSAALDIRDALGKNSVADASPFAFSVAVQAELADQPLRDAASILRDLIVVCHRRQDPQRAALLEARLGELRQHEHHPSHATPAGHAGAGKAKTDSSGGASLAFTITGVSLAVEADHGAHNHAIASIHTLDGAAHAAERLTGRPARGYASADGGRLRDDSARSVLVPADGAMEMLFQVRAYLPLGFQVFIGVTHWSTSDPHDGLAELVIIQSDDALAAVRLAGTRADRPALNTDQMVAHLRIWHTMCGLDIISAETDSIGCQLLRLPDDPLSFCQELRLFCPEAAKVYDQPESLRTLVSGGADILRLHWA